MSRWLNSDHGGIRLTEITNKVTFRIGLARVRRTDSDTGRTSPKIC